MKSKDKNGQVKTAEEFGLEDLKSKDFISSYDMLNWQFMVLLQQLGQVQLHSSDSTCPCRLGAEGEYFIPKHLNLLAALANETVAKDKVNCDLLFELGEDATIMHLKTKAYANSKVSSKDLLFWSRAWRKRIEPIYYDGHVGNVATDATSIVETVKTEEELKT
jgi:hypothetical protein